MKLWLPLALLGGSCLGGVFLFEELAARVGSIYVAGNFFILSLAYYFQWPGIWLKRADGKLVPVSYFLFLPLHILTAASWRLATVINKEAAANQVAPNVWLGRRLRSEEAVALFGDSPLAVLDLTSEFSETGRLRTGRYLCLPTLDHSALTQRQLRAGVEFISSNSRDGVVYVHCALGHGRSAMAAAAWLLCSEPRLAVEAAIQQLKAARPSVQLNREQRMALEQFVELTRSRQETR